jgi:hypothetical protein
VTQILYPKPYQKRSQKSNRCHHHSHHHQVASAKPGSTHLQKAGSAKHTEASLQTKWPALQLLAVLSGEIAFSSLWDARTVYSELATFIVAQFLQQGLLAREKCSKASLSLFHIFY